MKIVLFFTYGVSLKTWQESGLLEREVEVYKRFAKNGDSVTFFTYGDKDDLQFAELLDGIIVIPAYQYRNRQHNALMRFLFSFTFPFIFKTYFRQADIFKTNQMRGSWVPLIAKFLCKKKFVVRCGHELLRNHLRDYTLSIKGFFEIIFYYLLEFFSYGAADKIIISSKTDRDFLVKKFGISKTKIVIIRNSIDTKKFKRIESSASMNNASADLLYVGRLIRRKNLHTLLQALAGMNMRLVIVGEGIEKEQLKNQADKEGVEVTFLGTVPNNKLPAILNQYPSFILPSLYENNPKTLLEAMACERFVIGANVAGINEVIEDISMGILCEPQAHSLREGLKKAKSFSADQRKKIGAAARSFVMRECDSDSIAKKEKDLYGQLLHETTRSGK